MKVDGQSIQNTFESVKTIVSLAIFSYTIAIAMKLDLFPLKLYMKKLSIGGFFGVGLAMNIFVWLWLWLHIPQELEELFLHYNILFGVDLIGPAWQVYLVPLSGFMIILVNFLLGWALFKKDTFASFILNFVACLVQLFLVIDAFLLVLLNV